MEYSEIKDFYDEIKNHNGLWVFDTNVNKKLVKLLDNSQDATIKNKIESERLIFNFSLQSGEVVPAFSSTSQNGELFCFPDYNALSEEGYSYLNLRSEEVTNPFLIIKYNHILWGSPKKHKKYAERAIDSYIKLFNASIDNTELSTHDKVNMLKNAIVIANESNYQIVEVKNLLSDVLFKEGYWNHGWKVTIIEFMLNQKWFKALDFNNVVELIETVNSELEDDLSSIHRNLEVAIRVAQKTNQSPKELKRKLGVVCEKIAEQREDDQTGMIPLIYLSEALSHYDSIKDKAAGERVSVKMTELKKKVKLAKISVPIDEVDTILEPYKRTYQKLLEYNPPAIFDFLSNNNPIIFPDLEKLKGEQTSEAFKLQDLFRTTNFDINNNISEPEDSKEDKKNRSIRQSYSLHLNLVSALFLLPLFEKGLKRGVITYETMIEHLNKNTWFGQSIEENRSGEKLTFTWAEMIAPSLYEFFKQLELSQLIGKYNIILVMDSLTLKFEGLLRDFAEVLQIKTVKSNSKSKNKRIQEMYIEDFLAHPKMREFFDENDRMFFDYLFLGNGINLRNNVAHSFYRPQDYSMTTAILLILAILRLSKYKFTEKTLLK